MSTLINDLKRNNPALAADYLIVGNQPDWALKNMVKALIRFQGVVRFRKRQKNECCLYGSNRVDSQKGTTDGGILGAEGNFWSPALLVFCL